MSESKHLLIKLERLLNANGLYPVLGPSCITFGENDEPLYPWLARRLVEELDIEIPDEARSPVSSSLDLQQVTSAYLRMHRPIEELSMKLDILLDSDELQPGPFLYKLASIGAFKLFFTIGFDPLLERALQKVRLGGFHPPRIWEFSLADESTDLPTDIDRDQNPIIAYLFGRISPFPSFYLWDRDAIEFVWRLQQALPNLPVLKRTLNSKSFLFLGSGFNDWLVRFFLRVINGKQLNQQDPVRFHFAESHLHANPDTVLFYDALHGVVEFKHGDPLSFANEFVDYVLPKYEIPKMNTDKPISFEEEIQKGSIFVSYAHDDAKAIEPLLEAMNRRGCIFWVDKQRLSAGENFETSLENAVKKRCGLFLSIISKTTEARKEAYFHRERHWAAERFQSFSHGEVFYIPVVIDDIPLPPKREPKVFESCHIFKLGEQGMEDLISNLLTLQQQDGVIE
jgi:hypothetical protein